MPRRLQFLCIQRICFFFQSIVVMHLLFLLLSLSNLWHCNASCKELSRRACGAIFEVASIFFLITPTGTVIPLHSFAVLYSLCKWGNGIALCLVDGWLVGRSTERAVNTPSMYEQVTCCSSTPGKLTMKVVVKAAWRKRWRKKAFWSWQPTVRSLKIFENFFCFSDYFLRQNYCRNS